MELPGPMEDIRRISDYAEAQEASRGRHKETSKIGPAVEGFLGLTCTGAFFTVLRLMFGPQSWGQLAWRVLLGAAVIWPVAALLVYVFGAGNIEEKKALWLGAAPSLFALIALCSPVILVLLVFVIALLIVIRLLGFAVAPTLWIYDRLGSISRRPKNGSK
jgi:hypothetical protein